MEPKFVAPLTSTEAALAAATPPKPSLMDRLNPWSKQKKQAEAIRETARLNKRMEDAEGIVK